MKKYRFSYWKRNYSGCHANYSTIYAPNIDRGKILARRKVGNKYTVGDIWLLK